MPIESFKLQLTIDQWPDDQITYESHLNSSLSMTPKISSLVQYFRLKIVAEVKESSLLNIIWYRKFIEYFACKGSLLTKKLKNFQIVQFCSGYGCYCFQRSYFITHTLFLDFRCFLDIFYEIAHARDLQRYTACAFEIFLTTIVSRQWFVYKYFWYELFHISSAVTLKLTSDVVVIDSNNRHFDIRLTIIEKIQEISSGLKEKRQN